MSTLLLCGQKGIGIQMETNNTIQGIMCSVQQCAYHTEENRCSAEKIEVGSGQTCCSSCDTECVTFKPCN